VGPRAKAAATANTEVIKAMVGDIVDQQEHNSKKKKD